jgi:hypothetical protein
MKTQYGRWLTILGLALIPILTESLSAQVVIPITGAGTATGSTYFPMEFAFDLQPLTPPTVGQTVSGASLGSNPNGDVGRVGYIDFGASFSSITITEVWTAYRFFSAYTGNLPSSFLSWSTDTAVGGGDIAETGFALATQPSIPGGSVGWTRDASGLSITPLARYLLVGAPTSGGILGGDRVTEIAFVGFTAPVPEPSSVMLLSLGLAVGGFVYRRRQSGKVLRA